MVNLNGNYTGWVVGDKGTILQTGDGGATWIRHDGCDPEYGHWDMAISDDAQMVYAVGQAYGICFTVDGGINFAKERGDTTGIPLYGVTWQDFDAKHLIAVGSGGRILAYRLIGTSWTRMYVNGFLEYFVAWDNFKDDEWAMVHLEASEAYDDDVCIMSRYTQVEGFLKGEVAEFYFWQAELLASEVNVIYQGFDRRVPNNELLSFFPLEEGASTILFEYLSEGSLYAAAYGGPVWVDLPLNNSIGWDLANLSLDVTYSPTITAAPTFSTLETAFRDAFRADMSVGAGVAFSEVSIVALVSGSLVVSSEVVFEGAEIRKATSFKELLTSSPDLIFASDFFSAYTPISVDDSEARSRRAPSDSSPELPQTRDSDSPSVVPIVETPTAGPSTGSDNNDDDVTSEAWFLPVIIVGMVANFLGVTFVMWRFGLLRNEPPPSPSALPFTVVQDAPDLLDR
eukprot:gene4496-5512_t